MASKDNSDYGSARRTLLDMLGGIPVAAQTDRKKVAELIAFVASDRAATMPDALGYKWRHHDPTLDKLAERLLHLVDSGEKRGATRAECFAAIWAEAGGGEPAPVLAPERGRAPQLSEPWFCCAEPMQDRVTLV